MEKENINIFSNPEKYVQEIIEKIRIPKENRKNLKGKV